MTCYICGDAATQCVTISGMEPLGIPPDKHHPLCDEHHVVFASAADASREARELASASGIDATLIAVTTYDFHDAHKLP